MSTTLEPGTSKTNRQEILNKQKTGMVQGNLPTSPVQTLNTVATGQDTGVKGEMSYTNWKVQNPKGTYTQWKGTLPGGTLKESTTEQLHPQITAPGYVAPTAGVTGPASPPVGPTGPTAAVTPPKPETAGTTTPSPTPTATTPTATPTPTPTATPTGTTTPVKTSNQILSDFIKGITDGTMDEHYDGTSPYTKMLNQLNLTTAAQIGIKQSSYDEMVGVLKWKAEVYNSARDASMAMVQANADKSMDLAQNAYDNQQELLNLEKEEQSATYDQAIKSQTEKNSRYLGYLKGKFEAMGMDDSAAGLDLMGKYMQAAESDLQTLVSKKDMAMRVWSVNARGLLNDYANNAFKIESDASEKILTLQNQKLMDMADITVEITKSNAQKNNDIISIMSDANKQKFTITQAAKDDIYKTAQQNLDKMKYDHQVTMDAANLAINQDAEKRLNAASMIANIEKITGMDIPDWQKKQIMEESGGYNVYNADKFSSIGDPNSDYFKECGHFSNNATDGKKVSSSWASKIGAADMVIRKDASGVVTSVSGIKPGNTIVIPMGKYGHTAVVTGYDEATGTISVLERNKGLDGQTTEGTYSVEDLTRTYKEWGVLDTKFTPEMESMLNQTQGGDTDAVKKLDVMSIAKEIGGVRAVTNPDIMAAVQTAYDAFGGDRNKTMDYMRTSGYSSEYSGDYRDAAEAVAMKLDASKRDVFTNSLDRSLQEGNTDRAKNLIKEGVRQSLNATEESKLRGFDTTLDFIDSIGADLKAYEDAGGDTGIFKGNVEKLAQKVGFSTDTPLAALRTKILIALQNYRRSMTGVAFGKNESAEYASIFPDIASVKDFNSAKMEALKQSFKLQSDNLYSQVLGRETYDNIFGEQSSQDTYTETDLTAYMQQYGLDRNSAVSELQAQGYTLTQ